MTTSNSFAGRLKTGTLPYVELPENPRKSMDRYFVEYVGEWIRRRVTKSVLCLKQDIMTVSDMLCVNGVHLVCCAGVGYDGMPATIDFGYGWKFSGMSESAFSPSIARLDIEYYRDMPSVLSVGLYPGLTLTEAAGVTTLAYNGAPLRTWSDTLPLLAGLEYTFTVVQPTLTTANLWAITRYNNSTVESFAGSVDTMTGEDGAPIKTELYWDYVAPMLTLKWWGLAWMQFDLTP